MKKYISAILIPCLLLQLYGCYSMREMTIDELKTYKGSETIKLNTKYEEIMFNGKSSWNHLLDWQANDSSIVIQSKAILLDNNSKAGSEEINIYYKDIYKIQIEKKDTEKTILLTAGILSLAIIVYAVIAISEMNYGAGLDF